MMSSSRFFNKHEIEQPITSRFEKQVLANPEAIAISYQTEDVTYQQLNARANRIARAIRATHKVPDQPVALMINQSIDLVAAILGVLKSSNIYVPIDGRQPPNMVSTVFDELQSSLVLSDQKYLPEASKLKRCKVLEIDRIDPGLSGENLQNKPKPHSSAYIYFTSGSTGKPKGVVDCHKNVLHNIMRYTNTLKIAPQDRLSMIQHSSFSGAVSSMFGALLNGATLCPYDLDQDGVQGLPIWIEKRGITIFHSVPSIFRYVAGVGGSYECLRIIRLEGDRATSFDAQLFQKHFAKECTLVNGLGATECGLVRQFFLNYDDPVPAEFPIGYSVPDMDIFLIDEEGNQLGSGEIGEICVRSKYLALGYWSNKEKTDEAFIQDESDWRIYKTGDLGKFHKDHCLEHLGRKDRQVKILGQTVNVEEVERLICSFSDISMAVIKTYEDHQHETHLAAYLVLVDPSSFSVANLRIQLAKQLPLFMIPSSIQVLEKLPTSANGKLDRQSLPEPSFDRSTLNNPYTKPKTATEHLLVSIWAKVLNINQVGAADNFLSLGGDSLKAARVIDELDKHQHSLNVVDFFEHLDLQSLACFLENKQPKRHDRLTRIGQRADQQRSSLYGSKES
ncbi:MAG: AMP-binding protein [Cyclobacteriaceae bacterium]